MLCLRSVSGLPLDVDVEMDRLMLDDLELDCHECRYIPLQEIVPGLLNKSLRYPESVYIQHRQVKRKSDNQLLSGSNVNYDVNYLPSVLLGIEYAKTQVYHQNCSEDNQVASYVEVLSGNLTVYMQKDVVNNDPYDMYAHAEETKLVQLKEGDKLAVPCNYMYTFINTHDIPVVFSRVFSQEHVMNSQVLQKQNGLAYYLISKNARQEVVSNPRYRGIPNLEEIESGKINNKVNYSVPTNSLYDDLVQNINQYVQISA